MARVRGAHLGSCVNKWYVNPHSAAAQSRLQEFDTFIHNLEHNNNNCHPFFKEVVFLSDSQTTLASLQHQLNLWDVPRVQSLLKVDVNKDLDPEADLDKMLFLKEIKATFLFYVRGTVTKENLTTEDALTLYTYFHRFKVLFEMEQYGMLGLWKACLRKVIDLIHEGEIAFLLLFMEWYPEMISDEHYITVNGDVGHQSEHVWKQHLQLACRTNPTLFCLFEKHQQRFQVYFQQH